jgi:cytochrome P450
VNDHVPPYPEPLDEPPSLLRRVWEGQSCPLPLFTKRMYRMRLGESSTFIGRKRYMVVEPSLVKQILGNRDDAYPKSHTVWRLLHAVIGNSIFVSNGAVWRRQRRLLEPAFGATRTKESFPRMLSAVEAMRQRLDSIESGTVFDIETEMTHVTADVIFRTICSVPITQRGAYETYKAFLDYQRLAFGDLFFYVVGTPPMLSPRWWRSRLAARRIRNVIDPVVRGRYESWQRGEPDPEDDILSALLKAVDPETGVPMNFEFKELVEQIAMLFLAGHETSAAALSWALYLLAANPAIQERLHAEAVSVLREGAPQFADMRRLVLARNVFRETLRLYPSVPFLARDATRTETMRNKLVRKGSILIVSPWLSHRNERLWSRPDVFDPDRFERGDEDDSVRAAYFPFSSGPRVCLGAAFALQEGILVLATIARDFHLATVENDVPMPLARLTLRSRNGIRLRITRRQAAGAT